jgi:hypothetical protein
MVHMKAPSVLFNFPYPKIWIRIFRYEFANFYEFWCRPRSPCLNSDYRNQILRYFWANSGELQVYDIKFETAKYEHSLRAKSFVRTAVFGGGSILAGDFRWCLKSTNFKPPVRGLARECRTERHGTGEECQTRITRKQHGDPPRAPRFYNATDTASTAVRRLVRGGTSLLRRLHQHQRRAPATATARPRHVLRC